jgi:hypothetical protein
MRRRTAFQEGDKAAQIVECCMLAIIHGQMLEHNKNHVQGCVPRLKSL